MQLREIDRHKAVELIVAVTGLVALSITYFQLQETKSQTEGLRSQLEQQQREIEGSAESRYFQHKLTVIDRFIPQYKIEEMDYAYVDGRFRLSFSLENFRNHELVVGYVYGDLVRCLNGDFYNGEKFVDADSESEGGGGLEAFEDGTLSLKHPSETKFAGRSSFPGDKITKGSLTYIFEKKDFEHFGPSETIALEIRGLIFDPVQFSFKDYIRKLGVRYGFRLFLNDRLVSFPAVYNSIGTTAVFKRVKDSWEIVENTEQKACRDLAIK